MAMDQTNPFTDRIQMKSVHFGPLWQRTHVSTTFSLLPVNEIKTKTTKRKPKKENHLLYGMRNEYFERIECSISFSFVSFFIFYVRNINRNPNHLSYGTKEMIRHLCTCRMSNIDRTYVLHKLSIFISLS